MQDDTFNAILGAVIRRERERRSIPQSSLADRTGITQSAISRIESGRMKVDAFLLRKLGEQLGPLLPEVTKAEEMHRILLGHIGQEELSGRAKDALVVLSVEASITGSRDSIP